MSLYTTTKNKTFEDWLEENEDELYIKAAETGADRELDFDLERWQENEYEEHRKQELNTTPSE